jgi:hypothetical protein
MATMSANAISTEFIESSSNRVSRYNIAPRSHTALLSTARFFHSTGLTPDYLGVRIPYETEARLGISSFLLPFFLQLFLRFV